VNCAGTTGPIETPVHELRVDDWDEVLAVNLRGTFLPTKYVVPVMLRQRRGKIVNIAGTWGLRGYRLRAAYSASKWAVRGFTRTVALEVGPHGSTSTASERWSAAGSAAPPTNSTPAPGFSIPNT
jgi:NAD(P)-dependent dehydrogenase (short-subunit alcohol dehydrogenase family)